MKDGNIDGAKLSSCSRRSRIPGRTPKSLDSSIQLKVAVAVTIIARIFRQVVGSFCQGQRSLSDGLLGLRRLEICIQTGRLLEVVNVDMDYLAAQHVKVEVILKQS